MRRIHCAQHLSVRLKLTPNCALTSCTVFNWTCLSNPCWVWQYSNEVDGILDNTCRQCAPDTVGTIKGRTFCTPPCPCGFNWTDYCDQKVGPAGEVAVYQRYSRTGLQIPMSNGLMCMMRRAIQGSGSASELASYIELIQNVSDSKVRELVLLLRAWPLASWTLSLL